MKMQTGVSRDGILANNVELSGSVRFVFASCRQSLARRLLRKGRDAGDVKISRAREATRLRGYEATGVVGGIGMPNVIGIPDNRQRTE